MTCRITIEQGAEADLDAGYVRYEKIRPGLGEEYLLCVDAVLGQASRNPLLYPIVTGEVHRAVVRRFPYLVLYVIAARAIHVLAVFPGQQRPTDLRRKVNSRLRPRTRR